MQQLNKVAVAVAVISANQGIGQSQTSNQNAQCVSGKDAIVSCDNENFQNQVNSGNNALAQQGGSGSGGNSANQGIGQSQASNQGSGAASGGDTNDSATNANTQSQDNSGSNAAAQQGGSDEALSGDDGDDGDNGDSGDSSDGSDEGGNSSD